MRRLFCDNEECSVRTFAEQVEGLTAKHARRTTVCRQAVERIGLALAGRPGVRLATGLGIRASRSIVLICSARCRAVPHPPSPRSHTTTVSTHRFLYALTELIQATCQHPVQSRFQ